MPGPGPGGIQQAASKPWTPAGPLEVSMPLAAAVVLGVAALGGTLLAMLRAKGGNPPLAFAFVHGAIAATGLVLLGIAAFAKPGHSGVLQTSFGVLVAAALLGGNLVRHHVKGALIPMGGMMLHALVAVLGYTVLLAYFFAPGDAP
jgi:hypothetical protein